MGNQGFCERGGTMKIKQINVALENTAGRLFDMTTVLKAHDVDIRSLCVTESTEFSVVHLIVDKTDIAVHALVRNGYHVTTVDVFALKAEDKPGGFMKVLEILKAHGLNIEYVYGFGQKSDNHAVFIFRITEIDKAIEVLKSGAVGYLTSEHVAGALPHSSWELIEDF